MNKKQYRIHGLPNRMAFPFKIGKYSSFKNFTSSPIKICHFSLEENSLLTIYSDTAYGSTTGWHNDCCWLMYDDQLNATHLLSDPPGKYPWLVPVTENYNKLWSDINN